MIIFNLHIPTRSQNFASKWQTLRTLTKHLPISVSFFRTEHFYNELEWNRIWMEVRSTHPGLIPKIPILYSIHPSFYNLLARWREHISGSMPWEDGKAPDRKRLEYLSNFVEHTVLHPTPATLTVWYVQKRKCVHSTPGHRGEELCVALITHCVIPSANIQCGC